MDFFWLETIGKIRESISTGDNGLLIVASSINVVIFAVLNITCFIGTEIISHWIVKRFKIKIIIPIKTILHLIIISLVSKVCVGSYELITPIVSLLLILILTEGQEKSIGQLFRGFLVSSQVFLAVQWLNIMPVFSKYNFGISEIPSTIKMVSIYLEGEDLLNMVGLYFFVPIFICAIITSILFVIHDNNTRIRDENYKKQKMLDAIKSKAMEHRIYQEVNSLAHDFKTPLVAMRGLNSLLSISNDTSKIQEYTKRIDDSIDKMNEMITSFLRGESKQIVEVENLINYIRAQIPTEDKNIDISILINSNNVKIRVNKVRVVRAIINFIENAIVVPTKFEQKKIKIRVIEDDKYVKILIEENGIGIRKDQLDEIWKEVYSSNGSSGLGLSFAKNIIQENEGYIELETKEGIGTIFKIKFLKI